MTQPSQSKENALAIPAAGVGERSFAGTLAGLLALTSDAVMAFDGLGRVLLANEVAERLFRRTQDDLVGSDVRVLFPPAAGAVSDEVFSLGQLPFSADGRATPIVVAGTDGSAQQIVVRCVRVSAPGETHLLVARMSDREEAAEQERDRLLGELSRANHRLSGTLKIVLDTLDSHDVMTLFERVLEEITDTMDATGTVFYVAESDGYHLRGRSSTLMDARVPRFIPFGRMIEKLATSTGHALRLRVLPPEGHELRQGRMTRRRVIDEETREVHNVLASVLPPFTTFIAVPVWFGSRLIALIEVGWSQAHPTRREDADLLDAVAQYLSVQLVGAFAALRSRREQTLADEAGSLRAKLMSLDGYDAEAFRKLLGRVSKVLDAQGCFIRRNKKTQEDTLVFPGGEERAFTLGMDSVLEAADGQGQEGALVLPIAESSELAEWLEDQGLPAVGAFVDLGRVGGERLCGMVLRPADAEPFDESEIAFVERVAGDAVALAHGVEARQQNRRIAQALQTGMRNELQTVEGITAQGIYSSATEAAVIGGDFYDLIRLPNRRACVIMGDVSGKGVEAASVSAAVKTALGAYSWQGLTPSHMVRLLNEFLLGFSRLETFATLFVGMVDLDMGTLKYCSAGHPPAILVRASTGAIESLGVQSGVVGAFHDMKYRDGRVKLSEGDMLLLYTDGTTEARATDGSFFGEDGLRDAVTREYARGFDHVLDRMLDTLDRFTSRSLEDDVAMVTLRFDEVGPRK